MAPLDYCYSSLIITSIYILVLLSNKRYRLCLPSVIYTSIWVATSFLMICQSTGFLVNKAEGEAIFSESSQFAFMLIIASIIGFTIAHVLTNKIQYTKVILVNHEDVNIILKRFLWIPILCGIIGVLLLSFFLSFTKGNFDLGDYRIIAITTKVSGYMEIVQRVSGHINFLGTFYLMLLGYYYGQRGINLSKFLLIFFLCSTINIAIAGRVWILSSSIPFLTTFIFARKHSPALSLSVKSSDTKKLFLIVLILISLFSVLGILRYDKNYQQPDASSFISKFFYLTDGAKMTNMVLKQYPEDCFDHEYGLATLANSFYESPMKQSFDHSISHDIGLSVTVKSYMPPLYYDFGKLGGAIFWCILCIIMECWAIKLQYRQTLFSVLLMGQICMMFFSTPVGNIFAIYTPAFEWLCIIYFLHNIIFHIPTKKSILGSN